MSKFLDEIVLPEQGSPPAPASGTLSLFAKADGLYVKRGTTEIGPLAPAAAFTAPANMVTTDTSQTITSSKTFTIAPTVPDGAFSIAKINGLQTTLDSKYSASNPPPASAAPVNMVTTDTNQTIAGTKTFSVAPIVPDGSWTIAKTNGLQASLDSKYSATNPQPLPGNIVTTDTAQTISGLKTFSANLTAPLVYETLGPQGPLKKFRQALALASSEAVDILSIGASVDEGYYAVLDEDRYIARVRRALQAKYNPAGVVGGEGFIPARHTVATGTGGAFAAQPQRWTYGGGWTLQGNWTYGIGRRYTMLDSATETATITVTGDRFWILYLRGTSVGAFTVTVDGGAPVTVDAYSTGLSTGRYDTGQLTAGSHTIVIQPTAGGANPTTTTRVVGLDGIMVFNGDGGANPGTGKGVRWWDGAHSGYTALDFNNTTWMTGLTSVNPDLVVINFGGNEYLLGQSSATFNTNLRGLIAKLRANVTTDPSIVLAKIYDLTDTTGYTPIEPWANYEAVLNQIAIDLGCAVIDFGERMPAAGAPAGSPLFAENIHPNPAGHNAMAEEFADFLIGQRNATVGTPSNMVTLDTVQTVSGIKTFTGVQVYEGGILNRNASPTSALYGQRVTGDVANRYAILANGTVQFGDGTNPLDVTLYRSGGGILATNGIFAATQVFDNGYRVYSRSNPNWTERNRVALKRWREALSDTTVKPADLYIMGDSIAEGYYASDFNKRWSSIVRDRLQVAYNPVGTAGGEGFVNPHVLGMAGAPDRWTYGGAVGLSTSASDPNGWGLGSRYAILDAAGDSATLTFFGTQVHLFFTRGSGTGNASISIDGGAPVTYASNAASTTSANLWSSPALARGTHTVTVTWGSALVILDGALVTDNDTFSGVRLWDAAHSGFTAATAASGRWNDYMASTSIGPELVILNYGANDINAGVTAAQFELDLTAVVNKIRTASATTSIAIMMIPRRSGFTDAAWQAYVDSAERVALAKSIAFIDLSQSFPTPTGTVGTGATIGAGSSQGQLYFDSVHLSDAGHRVVADLVLNAIAQSPSIQKAVTLDSDQTFSGTKTFTSSPVVPDASFTIAKTTGLQAALDSKYSASNPPPASSQDLSSYATTTYVDNRFTTLTGAAPAALDTLNELATALGNDANFASTVTTSLATKVTLTGNETIAGVKTFSSAPVVPDGSWTIAKTTGLQTALDSKYSATNPPPASAASTAANVVISTRATAHKMTVAPAATPPAAPAIGDVWLVPDVDAPGATQQTITPTAVPFSYAGAITVKTGVFKFPIAAAGTIDSIQITAGTASAGASIIADVNLNGTTVYTTQANRPTLAAGAVVATAPAPNVTTVNAGDYLTVDIDQIGTTTAGSDVMVVVRIRRV